MGFPVLEVIGMHENGSFGMRGAFTGSRDLGKLNMDLVCSSKAVYWTLKQPRTALFECPSPAKAVGTGHAADWHFDMFKRGGGWIASVKAISPFDAQLAAIEIIVALFISILEPKEGGDLLGKQRKFSKEDLSFDTFCVELIWGKVFFKDVYAMGTVEVMKLLQ